MSTIPCVIWGQMPFDAQFMKIIECDEFQRLRNIKQLGFVYTLYAGATHTRYNHSLGTAYLCGRMLDILQKNSSVQISVFHQKCVIAAGLLTDVGHGPFSHAWQKIKGNRPHKERCVEIVAKILRERVPDFFSPELMEDGITLVKALIWGDATSLPNELKYLAEIVCNNYFELDVKKIDFLRRDMFYVKGVEGVPNELSIDFFDRANIRTDGKGEAHIAYHFEDQLMIQEFFRTRHKFRMYVYHHPNEILLTKQFCMLMQKADISGFRLNGQKVVGPETNLQQLDDSILSHFEIWLDKSRSEIPTLYQDYMIIRDRSNNTPNLVAFNMEPEALKTPLNVLFHSIAELQRLPVNY